LSQTHDLQIFVHVNKIVLYLHLPYTLCLLYERVNDTVYDSYARWQWFVKAVKKYVCFSQHCRVG